MDNQAISLLVQSWIDESINRAGGHVFVKAHALGEYYERIKEELGRRCSLSGGESPCDESGTWYCGFTGARAMAERDRTKNWRILVQHSKKYLCGCYECKRGEWSI